MPQPPPTPAAGQVPPPPLFNFVFTNPADGILTVQAVSMFTTLWAFLIGNAGVVDDVGTLKQQMIVLFGMHGDATITPLGVITVTKTNGVPFGYFATGTDAANLTGTINPARIASNSLAYAKLLNAAGPILLGASAAGPIISLTVGRGLDLSAGTLSQKDTVSTVAGLPAPAAGLRGMVTDSTVTAAGNFGAAVAGGGGNFCPVYSDGAGWFIG